MRLRSFALASVARTLAVVAAFGLFSIASDVGRTSGGAGCVAAAEPPAASAPLDGLFTTEVRPLLERYCQECHAGDRIEAEIDLSAFPTAASARRRIAVWQKVAEMLDGRQMPPRDSRQPTDAELARLQGWVKKFLSAEAAARAGDPGPVVLRRLSNVEYDWTVRDLTGVESLSPTREFPVDSAAGEGFTNVGSALVMSPALVAKFLDAGKEVAAHAVLLPDGVRFSPSTTRRDWTNEALDRVRALYGRYSAAGGGSAVDLQGIRFDTNQGGRLPVERYFEALLVERETLAAGRKTIDQVANERKLSPKYLQRLRTLLEAPEAAHAGTPIGALHARWKAAGPGDAALLARETAAWQTALFTFNSIGHIGREGGPKAWQEAKRPLTARQEFRVKLPTAKPGEDVVIYLAAGDAGDGAAHDAVVWERPRLSAPGRPDLLLRDVGRVAVRLAERRDRQFAQTARCLAAAAEVSAGTGEPDLPALAKRFDVDVEGLTAWFDYLGVGAVGPVRFAAPLVRKIESAAGYDFVKGWIGDDALSVLANSSDQTVRIPGTMGPHSVGVHPSPTQAVGIGWKSPVAAGLTIEAFVQHAHHDCGNGVAWTIELRRGASRRPLATGISQGPKSPAIEPLRNVAVRPGDVVTLVVSPRDGNHACDMTAVDLTLSHGERRWNLAKDVSSDILASNPHADGRGVADVWHFFSEPAGGATRPVAPAGSLLARWQSATGDDERRAAADKLQQLLLSKGAGLPAESPDAELYRQVASPGGPFQSALQQAISAQPSDPAGPVDGRWGLPAARFGKSQDGPEVEAASLLVRAPELVEVRLPAELAAGAEFVVAGGLHPAAGAEGCVQLQLLVGKSDGWQGGPGAPFVTGESSAARRRLEAGWDAFRETFPPALCYAKIVPVDEVVTLTLYYREDEPLRRLMLDDAQAAELDRLWDELLYIAREPLEMVVAFEQISEFATQDRPDLVKAFEPLRQPILDRAAAFRKRLVDTEPAQLDALLQLADRAFRRPLTEPEATGLRQLYARLRAQEIGHDEAFRLTLARVLIAPAFLYRLERPGPGADPTPVSDYELAARLSYFLWSSLPDDELRRTAAAGKLRDPATLVAQTRRMLADPKARRLATEFACHWLHIHGFDRLDEKSERHFPTFASVRGPMYEEAIQFFTDLFQNDRSLRNLIDADYTYLNEELAKHYGVPGVTGTHWRRVDGVRAYGRGGVLTFGAALAKQSGASRTSPILRGNWLSEVVLGEKLPRPPKNVPQLGEEPPAGLTERQLIERHSSDPACAKCHARIDPLGFALESYDAIGRFRKQDAAGLPIDTKTALPDGVQLAGVDDLRRYLGETRRDAVVRQFQRKLLGFALGRAVQLSDEPLLDEMQARLVAADYRFQTAVEAIVTSRQFREIRGAVAVDPE